MANKIKNKFTSPKATEFTPKDLVVDIKNGRLYYKSNFGVYEVRGTLFSSTSPINDATNLGNSQATEIIFNNAGIYDGINDFTITNIQGDGTGTVNIGTAIIGTATISNIGGSINFNSHALTNVDINSGTIDGITSLTSANNLDIGSHGFRANTLTADGLTSGRVIFAGSNGLLSDDSNFTFGNVATNILEAPIIELDSDPGAPSIDKIRLGEDGNKLEVRTNFGNLLIGPQNSTYSHFYTDRDRYYFNRSVIFDQNTSLEYTLSGYQTDDFIITTNAKAYSSNYGGGRIKLAGTTTSNAANGAEIKGNLKILPSGDSNQAGIFRASGDIIAFASDKRLKENIVEIPNPLDKIKQLRGVYYDWKENVKEEGFYPTRKTNEIGMIAQEVEKVIPQAIEVAPFNKKYKTIKYDRIIPLLVECIKDQQKQIDELKNKLDESL